MNDNKYDLAIVMGRFQFVHLFHEALIDKARSLANHTLIVVGSAYQAPSIQNPLSFKERASLLSSLYPWPEEVSIKGQRDYNDDTVWAINIQKLVSDTLAENGLPDDAKIVIVGHEKDESSFYLKMFPQWDFFETGSAGPLSATDVREIIYKETPHLPFLENVVSTQAMKFIRGYVGSPEWEYIRQEIEQNKVYKSQFAGLAYPPTFVTVDAVLVCMGHVLMVKRKASPGKGLWALPGGFLNADTDRSLVDAMIRELREETMLKVPSAVLRGSIQESRVFDAINRSARGRTITHAFFIELGDNTLPKVKGADDAEVAKWIPIHQVDPETCFEDHWQILQSFTI